ncbi:hypothetical protein, partial [Acinetobacter baumannii]|uniref:hypothetical protein n=2 Tax=Acinetobacter baumannii TaxID=470 RepID=UPI0034621E73
SANKANHCSLVRCMMITLAVDNGRQGKVDQLGLECVVGVTLTLKGSQIIASINLIRALGGGWSS